MTGKDKRNKITSYIDVHAEQWRHLNRNKSMISNQATICWSRGPISLRRARHSECFTLTNVYLRWYVPQPFILDMEWSKTHISERLFVSWALFNSLSSLKSPLPPSKSSGPTDRERWEHTTKPWWGDGIDIGEEIERRGDDPFGWCGLCGDEVEEERRWFGWWGGSGLWRGQVEVEDGRGRGRSEKKSSGWRV